MTINIHSQNFALDPETREYIEEELTKISKTANPLKAAVYISRHTHHRQGQIYQIAIDLQVPPKIIQASIKGSENIRLGLNLTCKKLKKQIAKYKSKIQQ